MQTTAAIMTPLGRFRLTADEQGLCELDFPTDDCHEDSRPVENEATHPLLIEARRQLLAYCQGALTAFDLPLSLAGTPFQREVWRLLQTIPYGQTMSYGELARQLGNRHLARAVGGAAHANPVAIIVPCHRLIGADGSLTGFGGGLAMKQSLLELEGIAPAAQKKRK